MEGRTAKWQKEKEQTTIYKTLHRNLMIYQNKPHKQPGVNKCAPEG